MKILYIMTTRMPTERAHGYQTAKVCEKLAGLGAEVSLWYPKTEVEESKRELFSFYGVKNNFSVRAVPFFLHSFVEGYINHSHSLIRNFFFFMSLLSEKVFKETLIITRSMEIAWQFKLRGNKTVYYAHNFPENRKWLVSFFLSGVSGIVANSEGTAAAFRKAGFKNVKTVRNGVELEDFVNLNKSKSELRSELSLPEDRKIVLYTGHLYPWKGVDVIVETAKIMKDEDEILFVLVGGTSHDADKYREITKSGNISNTLVLGHKEKMLIPSYLKSADILLMPNIPISDESQYYTAPVKMFEYMSSGVPIISSDLPSLREILNEGNSVLIGSGNPEKLREAILLLLGDKNKSARISGKALSDAQKYSWDNQVGELYGFLAGL